MFDPEKFMAADEATVRRMIAEIVSPRPWKHDGITGDPYAIGEDICSKCSPNAWVSLSSPCPIPDPVEGSLADIAEELKSKVSRGKYTSSLFSIYCFVSRDNDFLSWAVCEATPKERICAALMCMAKEVEK